ncbi:MAG: hypothetical protein MUD02_05975 [Bacteroidales bacterium]|jgi:hypothetical protein|nr:hypothetical protein [Bacteroidales bacterium]
MKNLIKIISFVVAGGFILASCEGPMGPAGQDGLPGVDANETCKECHNPTVVDIISTQFQLSKHHHGEAAFEEAGNTGCSPCHTQEAFRYVSKNNTPATFTLNATTGKYANDYVAAAGSTYGDIGCYTCHSSLHTTYEATDFAPLTWNKAVDLSMWKGTKSINLTQDGGSSNLCIKCHQPRPLVTSTSLSNGDVVDYNGLATSPNNVFYDAAVGNAAPNKVIPSYRTHVHYGTVGAVYAGVGGVQFSGSQTYANTVHTTAASCQDCHMSSITGRAGGHTFTAKGNFNGCNATGCHSGVSATSSTFWTGPRNEIKTLLNNLATKINKVGQDAASKDILHSDSDPESNLWAGLTTGNFDGYLNIYDPSTNPGGVWKNPGSTGSWTAEAKAINNALPTFPTLKNVVMGSMINFQFCLRDYSLGIHNFKYTKALLTNSIEAMTAAGY